MATENGCIYSLNRAEQTCIQRTGKYRNSSLLYVWWYCWCWNLEGVALQKASVLEHRW